MKKLLLICFILNAALGFSNTIIVREKDQPQAIQHAINKAHDGDTILIQKGTYRENTINVNKRVFIKGVGGPVIDGEKKNEILVVNRDGVIIEGLTVMNGGYSSYNDIAAIRLVNVRNVIVRNNVLVNTFFGIYSQHGSNCIIVGNKLTSNAKDELNSANGIHCWKSDSMQISGNTITGHRDGIYFEFVTNSVIKGNNSYDNVRYGLHFMFSNNDTYIGNTFSDNGAGVAVMFSHHVDMLRNKFIDNWGASSYGILLKEISDGTISGNEFRRNSTGVYMEGSNRLAFSKNSFTNNGWALKIQASCDGNSFIQNNFSSNSFDVATNGTLVLSTFDSNYWDKYEGYDLNHNGIGDIPFRPVSVYSMIVERNPTSLMLFRSFMVSLLDKSEKVIPGLTPENLKDDHPKMKPIAWE